MLFRLGKLCTLLGNNMVLNYKIMWVEISITYFQTRHKYGHESAKHCSSGHIEQATFPFQKKIKCFSEVFSLVDVFTPDTNCTGYSFSLIHISFPPFQYHKRVSRS